jgi:DNA polymerase
MEIVIDYETRSACDLTKYGLWNYSIHPTTDILCCSVKIDGGETRIWINEKYSCPPEYLKNEVIPTEEFVQIMNSADKYIAHKAMFERIMTLNVGYRYGIKPIPLEKAVCTMAMCGYHALPLSLEGAGKALNLPILKDKLGYSAMLKLCKPRKPNKKDRLELIKNGCIECEDGSFIEADGTIHWLWNEDEKTRAACYDYCCTDTDVEYLLYKNLSQLPPFERQIWELDQQINLKGLPVDTESANAIVKLVTNRESVLLKQFDDLVGGEVSGPRSYVAFRNWVNKKLDIELESLDKDSTEELLRRTKLFSEKDPEGIVKRVLEIKSEIAKASVAKFRSFIEKSDDNGLLRFLFQYFSASTGRFGGRDLQPQNLPRDSYPPKMYELIIELFKSGNADGISLLYDEPFYAASRCIRGTICAKDGMEFLAGDFSSVEAVGNCCLAGDEPGIETFRKKECAYSKFAACIFGIRYEDVKNPSKERQTGKCGELALGFLGGIGAFASMSKTYGIDLEILPDLILGSATPDELDGEYGAVALAQRYVSTNPDTMSLDAAISCDVIKRRWRESHPAIVSFGKSLEIAAKDAIQNHGKVFKVRDIRYCYTGGFLKCMLPSGRLIHYYDPKLKNVETEFGLRLTLNYMGVRTDTTGTSRQWCRVMTYSGKLLENVVQGVCRDLLCHSMLNLRSKGFDIRMHVHDEIVALQKVGQRSLEEFLEIMTMLPPWAADWPIRAEGWSGQRYRK